MSSSEFLIRKPRVVYSLERFWYWYSFMKKKYKNSPLFRVNQLQNRPMVSSCFEYYFSRHLNSDPTDHSYVSYHIDSSFASVESQSGYFRMTTFYTLEMSVHCYLQGEEPDLAPLNRFYPVRVQYKFFVTELQRKVFDRWREFVKRKKAARIIVDALLAYIYNPRRNGLGFQRLEREFLGLHSIS